MISGYFSWKKKIESVRDLLYAIVKRYINFATMVLACNLLGYFLQIMNVFPIERATELLGNNELPFGNTIAITNLLKSVFLLKSPLNGALWMMRDLFLGNCIVYFVKYLYNLYIYNSLNRYIKGLLGGILIGIMYYYNWIIAVTFSGVFLCGFMVHITYTREKHKISNIVLIITVLGLIVLVQNPGVFAVIYHVYVTIICGLIIGVVQLLSVGERLAKPVLYYLRKCSISIYCCHILIVYSLGLWIYIACKKTMMDINVVVVITYGCTMVATLLAAYFYAATIESVRNRVVERITPRIN